MLSICAVFRLSEYRYRYIRENYCHSGTKQRQTVAQQLLRKTRNEFRKEMFNK